MAQLGTTAKAPAVEGRIFFDAAAPLYFVLLFVRFYFESPFVSYVATIVSIVYGTLLLLASLWKQQKNSVATFLVAALLVCALFTMMSGGNDVFRVLPQFLANLGFAWSMLYARLRPKLFLSLYFILLGFFFYNMSTGVDPGNIFVVSRNFISVLIILSVAMYYFSCQRMGYSPPLFVPLLGMLVMLWAVGRAGIMSGLIILAGTMFLPCKRYAARFSVVAIFVAGFFYFQSNAVENLKLFYGGLERFEKLSIDSPRNDINRDYIKRISTDGYELIFGAPLSSIQTIRDVDGNPHNSYIRLHIAFGLVGVLIFTLAVLIALINLLDKKQYMLILILMISIFRSAFDSTAFHGPLDMAIFYCIFVSLGSKRFVFCDIPKKT